jgi:hypothetical protein
MVDGAGRPLVALGAAFVTVTVTTGAPGFGALRPLADAEGVGLGLADAMALGDGGGGGPLAGVGEPSTVTEPLAFSRRNAGFGFGTSP